MEVKACQAMIQMKESKDKIDILNFKSKYGALLFAAPTNGMDADSIGTMVMGLPARFIASLLDQRNGFRLRQR